MAFEKVTDFLDTLEENYAVPSCDCIVTRGHEVVYRHSAGHRDLEKRESVGPQDFYFLFSATKVITALAAARLLERGSLRLEDPLDRYLPEYGQMRVIDREYRSGDRTFPMPALNEPSHPAGRKITIRDVLSMTAGFSYDTHSEALEALRERSGGHATTRQIAAAIAEMPLLYEPGTRWAYSLGHDVLAAAIEAAAGQSFGDYLKEHIFEPLGVRDLYPVDGVTPISALYAWDAACDRPVPIGRRNDFVLSDRHESGGAGLMGTVEAYSAVLQVLANGGEGANGARILKPETAALFSVPVTCGRSDEDFRKAGKGAYSYGLGVRVKSSMESGRTPLGEFGWDSAGGAYVLADPIHRVSVFYVQHVVGYPRSYFEIHPTLRDLIYEGLGL